MEAFQIDDVPNHRGDGDPLSCRRWNGLPVHRDRLRPRLQPGSRNLAGVAAWRLFPDNHVDGVAVSFGVWYSVVATARLDSWLAPASWAIHPVVRQIWRHRTCLDPIRVRCFRLPLAVREGA